MNIEAGKLRDKSIITKLGLIILAVVLLITWVTVEAQTPIPNPDTLLQDCARNLQADRPMPSGADAPSIKIIAPTTQTVIVSDETPLVEVNFTVEVQNWKLPGFYTDDPAPHWHLWLNDSVWGMFYQTEALSGIPYGTWRMCASLGDANHVDVGVPDAILLTVERRGSQTAVVTVQPTTAPTNSSAEPISVLLIILLGFLALSIGLVLGRRAGQSR